MSSANPIINGLVTAFQLKQAMDHASLQREELARRKSRDKREDDLTDFQSTMALMNSGAKPVSPDGTYQSSTIQQPTLPNFGDMTNAKADVTTPMQTNAPTDPNRTVRMPGTGKQFYVPTQDEQFAEGFQRQLQTMHAASDIKTQEKMAELGTQFNFQAGIHQMDNSSKEGIARLNNQAQDVREQGRQRNQRAIADATNQTHVKVAGMTQSGQNNRTAFVQSEENARQTVSEEGKNKRAKTNLGENSRLLRIKDLDEQYQKLDKEENELHAQRYSDGAAAAGPGLAAKKQGFDSVQAREGALSSAQNRIKSIQNRKEEIRRAQKLLNGGNTAPGMDSSNPLGLDIPAR